MAVMACCALGGSAQSTFKLKDLKRQQEALAAAAAVGAGSGAEMQAIKPELSVVRQQYRLERNGEYFGKNNKPFYGEGYSLAIKVSGGTIFLSDVVTPWERDLDYARDNVSGKYTPVLFWTYQRPVDQADYKSVNFEVKGESEYVRPMNSGKDLYMHVDAISNFGLNIDNAEGFKKGYMIWAYSRSDVQDSAMVVDFQQLPYEVEAKADSSLLALSVLNPEKILGGLFVTPKFDRGGRVQYFLSGVAIKGEAGSWNLQLLCVDDKMTKTEQPTGITKTETAEKRKDKGGKKKKSRSAE